MAKNRRKHAEGVSHKKGEHKCKSGPKRSKTGKRATLGKAQRRTSLSKANWKLKIPKLIASLALERGESMDAGVARMALYTTLKVIDEAEDLRFDVAGEKVQGLHACFERAAELTGSSPLSLKRLFWSHLRPTVKPTRSPTPPSAVAARIWWTRRLCTK